MDLPIMAREWWRMCLQRFKTWWDRWYFLLLFLIGPYQRRQQCELWRSPSTQLQFMHWCPFYWSWSWRKLQNCELLSNFTQLGLHLEDFTDFSVQDFARSQCNGDCHYDRYDCRYMDPSLLSPPHQIRMLIQIWYFLLYWWKVFVKNNSAFQTKIWQTFCQNQWWSSPAWRLFQSARFKSSSLRWEKIAKNPYTP